MARRVSPIRLLWPIIEDAMSARAASRLGIVGCGIIAAASASTVTYYIWTHSSSASPFAPKGYMGAVIFAGLGAGIWRMWRSAAVVAFLLYFTNLLMAALHAGRPGGLIAPFILGSLLISGIRGTVAYHGFAHGASSGGRVDV